MRYTAAHAYRAERDGDTFGPWAGGEEIDLEPADAEWINRDSPGALIDPAVVPDPDPDPDPDSGPEPEAEPEPKKRQAKTAANRQHQGGAAR